ncbi:hypothetical protein [Pseudonocardia sp. TRM90224]|uniref:hypothetical protein n=1 Tax=Pseudonocardia sp. TRM90224 TaxID=2812678 RepID=UPI001E36A062|nr:hypothetical protein [Pseudonocardia sp. TRM90224]
MNQLSALTDPPEVPLSENLSPGEPPEPFVSIHTALMLGTLIVGNLAGLLGFAAHHDRASAALIAGGAMAGAVVLLHSLIARRASSGRETLDMETSGKGDPVNATTDGPDPESAAAAKLSARAHTVHHAPLARESTPPPVAGSSSSGSSSTFRNGRNQ